MLRIRLVFWESEPQYAYKRYAYKKKHVSDRPINQNTIEETLLYFYLVVKFV